MFGIATQPPDAKPAGEKRARGAYYTPDALAIRICERLRDDGVSPRTILEPGCGGGAFLRAAAHAWPRSDQHGVDLLPACEGPGLVEQRDLFTVRGKYELVIGNPDFEIAEKTVRHCLGLLSPRGVLAFLLRVGFLASLQRVPLYRQYPLHAFAPIAGRPSFTDGGTDQYDYGLFVWKLGHYGDGHLLQPLEWKR